MIKIGQKRKNQKEPGETSSLAKRRESTPNLWISLVLWMNFIQNWLVDRVAMNETIRQHLCLTSTWTHHTHTHTQNIIFGLAEPFQLSNEHCESERFCAMREFASPPLTCHRVIREDIDIWTKWHFCCSALRFSSYQTADKIEWMDEKVFKVTFSIWNYESCTNTY